MDAQVPDPQRLEAKIDDNICTTTTTCTSTYKENYSSEFHCRFESRDFHFEIFYTFVLWSVVEVVQILFPATYYICLSNPPQYLKISDKVRKLRDPVASSRKVQALCCHQK